jgi:hypothetical protein
MNVGEEAADVKRELGVERGSRRGSPEVSRLDSASLGLTNRDDDPGGRGENAIPLRRRREGKTLMF